MLEDLENVRWSDFEQPGWNKPGAIQATLRRLAALQTSDEAREANASVLRAIGDLYGTGDDLAGSMWPVVLPALPFLIEIAKEGRGWSRFAALKALFHLFSFFPEVQFETIQTADGQRESLRRPVRRRIREARAVYAAIAEADTMEENRRSARELLQRLGPQPPQPRSTAILEYDPSRGGFLLQFDAFVRYKSTEWLVHYDRVEAFGGLLALYMDESDRIAAIESFWDHGGLPLGWIHEARNFPRGEFPIEGAELRVGALQLRQNSEKLELWFSTGDDLPRDHWSRQDDAGTGVIIWFSQHKAKAGWPVPGIGGRAECHLVAGLALNFDRMVAMYPVSSLRLLPTDFK